jgi:hypothetical protein
MSRGRSIALQWKVTIALVVIVMIPVAASIVFSENGRRNTMPEKSPVRMWTNWPAREPVARSGA